MRISSTMSPQSVVVPLVEGEAARHLVRSCQTQHCLLLLHCLFLHNTHLTLPQQHHHTVFPSSCLAIHDLFGLRYFPPSFSAQSPVILSLTSHRGQGLNTCCCIALTCVTCMIHICVRTCLKPSAHHCIMVHHGCKCDHMLKWVLQGGSQGTL